MHKNTLGEKNAGLIRHSPTYVQPKYLITAEVNVLNSTGQYIENLIIL